MATYKNMWKLFGQSQVNNSLSRVQWTFTRNNSIRRMEKKLGLPPRPKKPLNPYFVYLVNQRPAFIRDNPDLSLQEITKKICQNWKTYDQNEKDKLKVTFQKEMEIYTRKIMEYQQSLTEQHKEAIKEHRANLKEDIGRIEKKKKLQEFERPKRPLPPYALYTQSIVNELGKTAGKGWFKATAKRWSELPQNEKEKFRTMHKELIEKCKIELIEWEAKMIKMGNTDLVRKTVLLDLEGGNIAVKVNVPKQAEEISISKEQSRNFAKDGKLTGTVDSSGLAKQGKIDKSQLDKPVQAEASVSADKSNNIGDSNPVDKVINVKNSVQIEEPVRESSEVNVSNVGDKQNEINKQIKVEQPKEDERPSVSSSKSSLWNWWSLR